MCSSLVAATAQTIAFGLWKLTQNWPEELSFKSTKQQDKIGISQRIIMMKSKFIRIRFSGSCF